MTKKATILSILVGLLMGVVFFWIPSVKNLFSTKPIYLIAAGSFLLSLIATLFFNQRPIYVAMFLSLGVILSYFCHAFYDITFVDSTSHSLLGLVVIVLVIGSFPTAIIGAYLGWVMRKFMIRPASKE